MSSNETKQALTEMFRENTGRAMLDSGDYYGRHWERNRSRDMEAEPDVDLTFTLRNGKDLEIEFTGRTFHWLESRLNYEPELTKLLWTFGKTCYPTEAWLETMERFPKLHAQKILRDQRREEGTKSLREDEAVEFGGIYGEGDPVTINSYNEENFLDQTIQFVYYEVEDVGAFVVLQIHGGCDVRGGYTRPRVFSETGDSELAMFDLTRCSIGCPEGHNWMSENGGFSFSLEDGATGGTDLGKFEVKVITNESEGEPGKLCVIPLEDPDKYQTQKCRALCPRCGKDLDGGYY